MKSGVLCILAITVGGLIVASLGCQAQKEAAQEASTIKPLALLYGQYIGQHRGQPPKSESEFKAFVSKQGKPLLDSFHVPDVETLFVSPRDKKQYVVRYGTVQGPLGPAGQPVIEIGRAHV
mgnify:CR=1 FL=1